MTKTGDYLFSASKENYQDFSSGRVLYGHSGATNFPVRLLNEIYLRAINYLQAKNHLGPYTIYDPLCGIAYSLTVLGFLHSEQIKSLFGSDIDPEQLETAAKNLALLKKVGLQKRAEEIQELFQKYQKVSHQEALESTENLLQNPTNHLLTEIFPLDILSTETFPSNINKIDIVIADLPYGQLADWTNSSSENSSQSLLNKISSTLNSPHIVVLIADKKQPIAHQGFQKVKSFKLGKRKVFFLEKL